MKETSPTEGLEPELAARLRELRVAPPDGFFSESLAARLDAASATMADSEGAEIHRPAFGRARRGKTAWATAVVLAAALAAAFPFVVSRRAAPIIEKEVTRLSPSRRVQEPARQDEKDSAPARPPEKTTPAPVKRLELRRNAAPLPQREKAPNEAPAPTAVQPEAPERAPAIRRLNLDTTGQRGLQSSPSTSPTAPQRTESERSGPDLRDGSRSSQSLPERSGARPENTQGASPRPRERTVTPQRRPQGGPPRQ